METEEPESEFQPGEVDSPEADEEEQAMIFLEAVREHLQGRHGRAWTRACRTARQKRWRQRSYEHRTRGSAPSAATRKSA